MKALTITLTLIALSVAPAMWAQEANTPGAAEPAQQGQAKEQTLTGCLAKAEQAFTLKTSSGEVALQGSGLDAHVGHTIRVTGTQTTVAGKSTFRVTKVEMVSPTCQS